MSWSARYVLVVALVCLALFLMGSLAECVA